MRAPGEELLSRSSLVHCSSTTKYVLLPVRKRIPLQPGPPFLPFKKINLLPLPPDSSSNGRGRPAHCPAVIPPGSEHGPLPSPACQRTSSHARHLRTTLGFLHPHGPLRTWPPGLNSTPREGCREPGMEGCHQTRICYFASRLPS